MNELTIIIESWGHKELESYMKSLNGIHDIKIKSKDKLEIFIKYDSNIINYKIIKMEIFLFLNILKVPSLIFNEEHNYDNLVINVYYNPELLNTEEMQKIELSLNL